MAVFSKLNKVVIIASALVSLINPVLSRPTSVPDSHSFDIDLQEFAATLEARGASKYIDFTGITGGTGPATGQVPTRQEFRTFAQDATNLNLYILALDRMMTTAQTNSTSFYLLGGIHGRPYKAWDGVSVSGANTDAGYCTHADILFPTWHRPYMALYEQTLWNLVQEIASEYSPGSSASAKYLAAAPAWRMPYWDWASNPQIPDIIATETTVSVEKPQGTVTISNPLYSYKFNPLNPSDLPDAPFNTMKETVRNPDQNGNTYTSNPTDLNAQLLNIGDNLRTRVYTILTAYTNYLSFSNKATTTSVNGQFDSLESIHDTIHGVVGGNGGHMGVIDYAAFDPIFYLHHTNIDRLFAIWQAINPSSYVTTGKSGYGTYAYPVGMAENAQTPLMPFHQSDGTYWTSTTAANVKSFGYTYPELVDWTSSGTLSATSLRANVIAEVNSLYGASQAGNLLSSASSIASVSSTSTAAQSSSKAVAATTSTTPKTTTTSSSSSSHVQSTTSKTTSVVQTVSAQSTAIPAASTSIKASTPTTSAKASTTVKATTTTTKAATTPTKSTPTPSPTTNWWNWNSWPWMWGGGWKKRDLSGVASYASTPSSTSLSGPIPTVSASNVDAVPPVSSIAPHIPNLIQHNYYQEYLADISVANSALNGTFSVFMFLGNYSSDPSEWALDSNLVGTHAVFAAASGGHDTIVAGSIPLTVSLLNRVLSGQLASLNITSVVPYLAQNLHWKLRSNDGVTVYSGDVESLQVQVASSQVQLPDSNTELPVWGPMVVQYNATAGKAAGLHEGETLGTPCESTYTPSMLMI